MANTDDREPHEPKERKTNLFTSQGEAVGYISLDQAVIRARLLAEETQASKQAQLGWDAVVWTEKSMQRAEDSYRIILQFRTPKRGLLEEQTGEEEFIFDLTGKLLIRQVLAWPEEGYQGRPIQIPRYDFEALAAYLNDCVWRGMATLKPYSDFWTPFGVMSANWKVNFNQGWRGCDRKSIHPL